MEKYTKVENQITKITRDFHHGKCRLLHPRGVKERFPKGTRNMLTTSTYSSC